MNKHDRQLIYKAKHCNQDFFRVWELETEAQSEECKQILRDIGSTYYHLEEASLDLL